MTQFDDHAIADVPSKNFHLQLSLLSLAVGVTAVAQTHS